MEGEELRGDWGGEVINYEQDELDMAEDAINDGDFKEASKHLDRFMMIVYGVIPNEFAKEKQ